MNSAIGSPFSHIPPVISPLVGICSQRRVRIALRAQPVATSKTDDIWVPSCRQRLLKTGTIQVSLLRAAVQQQHQAGRLPEALALYNQVIVGDPRNGAAYCNKAAILAGQGKYVEAISALEQNGQLSTL